MTAIDHGKVNVRFRSAITEADILYVGTAGRCHPMRGRWYCDVGRLRRSVRQC